MGGEREQKLSSTYSVRFFLDDVLQVLIYASRILVWQSTTLYCSVVQSTHTVPVVFYRCLNLSYVFAIIFFFVLLLSSRFALYPSWFALRHPESFTICAFFHIVYIIYRILFFTYFFIYFVQIYTLYIHVHPILYVCSPHIKLERVEMSDTTF